VSALNTERWVEAAPIPVLQEQDVVYLEDEGVFVLWNDGDPFGIHEEVRAGDTVVYCAPSETFITSNGAIFDRRGRAQSDGEGRGLVVLRTQMDGHLVFVDPDPSNGRRATTSPAAAGAGGCEAPGGGERGVVPAG
jgi:hypothetical protein